MHIVKQRLIIAVLNTLCKYCAASLQLHYYSVFSAFWSCRHQMREYLPTLHSCRNSYGVRRIRRKNPLPKISYTVYMYKYILFTLSSHELLHLRDLEDPPSVSENIRYRPIQQCEAPSFIRNMASQHTPYSLDSPSFNFLLLTSLHCVWNWSCMTSHRFSSISGTTREHRAFCGLLYFFHLYDGWANVAVSLTTPINERAIGPMDLK
jgi:hypothetical protein